jgi:serine/threonine protein kinase
LGGRDALRPEPSAHEVSGARDAFSGERIDAPPSSDARAGVDCLAPELIEAALAGALEPSQRARSYEHLGTCRACVERLSRAGDAIFGGSLAPGSLVARRYRILRFVAQGGMGEVYEAYDIELSLRVALKMVPAADEQRPAALRALGREVLLARSVAHPNVCRIFDLGLHDAGLHTRPLRFLTMEFVDGERLTERIAQGPLELGQVRSIAHDLLLGLGAAHRAGVLHRDFKSDNVLLREGAGEAPQAVIMDFGLARSLDARGAHTSSPSHRVEGSLYYMAPEQLLGQALGCETDIYGFGVVLFEMLTGRTPFAEQITLGAAMQRCDSPAPRPSALEPSVPPALDRLVQRCLSPQRTDRFSSAEATLAALDEAFAPEQSPWSERMLGRSPMIIGFLTLAGLGMEADQLPPRHVELALTPTPGQVATRPAAPALPLSPARPPPSIASAPLPPPVLKKGSGPAHVASSAVVGKAAPAPEAVVHEPLSPTEPSAGGPLVAEAEAEFEAEAEAERDRRDSLLDPFAAEAEPPPPAGPRQ